MKNRKQRVTLNGQTSFWTEVNAGVPQGSILGTLLFLIYINDLPDGLSSNVKLFADDTSLFSVVYDIHSSASVLNKDLKTINEWALQWKLSFNPDPNKQAQEVIFTRKSKNMRHPPLIFNKSNVFQSTTQKHLGLILDNRLSFEEYLTAMRAKISRTIALLRKLQHVLPRHALINIYKSFIRPYLDYGDILYDKAFNESFHQKIESFQYNACLAITGAIRGSSREKNYQELGLESLQHRRWYQKLCYFYKIYNEKSPDYLFQLIPPKNSSCTTRNADNIPFFKFRHNFFKNSFFPSTIAEWNKLAPDLRNSGSFSAFKKSILNFIRPSPNSIFNCHDPKALKFITRLRLGLSHLRYHKFKHNFQDSLNPLCNCGLLAETTSHYLLHCPLFADERKTFLSNIKSIDHKFLEQNDSTLTQTFLYGDPASSVETNTLILNAIIQYVLSSKRFEEALL